MAKESAVSYLDGLVGVGVHFHKVVLLQQVAVRVVRVRCGAVDGGADARQLRAPRLARLDVDGLLAAARARRRGGGPAVVGRRAGTVRLGRDGDRDHRRRLDQRLRRGTELRKQRSERKHVALHR